ncbi:lasso peptide biosynthesis B2 protein [Novosphingobium sp. NBM11]|uniref:lasso peptide biosynthesis B2 protein n=1 Tax=Novosphingobium sp. NBM11 TaxID=2596914 RepID=UPI00189269CC|nr:lasso peptide biosynthesis B2 protein [Novosphingobium sp. NBM11]MBF5089113.1 lasso peptide biosynthesis B2 protein [Novosphingobium sp. NBM11]
MGFRLRDDLHFCRSGDRTVFLDLRADRYFSLPSKADMAFQEVVQKGSLAARPEVDCLLGLGVLIEGPPDTRPRPCAPAHPPRDSMVDVMTPRPSPLSLATASLALAQAEAQLRFMTLHRMVGRIAWIKTRLTPLTNPELKLHAAVEAFSALSRWVSARDRCLPRSMAMAKLLLSRDVGVEMVFGVAARPFRAHCWVQYEHIVLNDHLENIHSYTPILVI